MREERLVLGEVTIVIRVSAEDSGGAMTVVEEIPPMVDTPLHVHSREDEGQIAFLVFVWSRYGHNENVRRTRLRLSFEVFSLQSCR